jgi:cohesin loading factor subunit SCC2
VRRQGCIVQEHHAEVVVRNSCRLLLTCAQVVAALPFRKADEPLATIVHANSIIAKRGEALLSAFKAASKHAAAPGTAAHSPMPAAATNVGGMDVGSASPPGEASAAAMPAVQNGSTATGLPSTVSPDLATACNASLAVSMLLLLKRYLLEAYSLASERVPLFATGSADRKKQVCGMVVAWASMLHVSDRSKCC